MTTAVDPMVGATVLGRYRIVARLAAGGMGVVYLARAEGAAGFAKPMVVKRVLPNLHGNDQMARLFIREAKILANLQHPNIVGVTDFGEEDGAYIMVLDYVRAYDLGVWAWHRQGKGELLPVASVVHIMIKVLDALEYAHTLSLPDGTPLDIIHADISPSNVLVDTDGQVRLLDFGIARMRGEVTKSTEAASIRGKFSYLPVEALDGSPPRVATDVYACGVTLYELLTGENPFLVEDDTVTIARVISHDPPPVSTVREGVWPELDAIVQRAMARDRTKRFESAKDFARELRRVQQVPDDEATRNIAAMAKQDYAAMPASAGLSLAELENAWRNAPAVGAPSSRRLAVAAPPTSSSKIALGLAPTVPPGKPSSASSPVVSGATFVQEPDGPVSIRTAPTVAKGDDGTAKKAVIAVAVVALLAGIVTGVVLYLGRRSEAEEPKIVLIERGSGSQAAPGDSVAPPTPKVAGDNRPATDAPDAGNGASANPPDPKASGVKSAKPAPAGDPLSAAFAKKQPEIETCFRSDTGTGGSPEISVRFTIDAAGVVQRAELTPADLAGAPLGQCILGVARRTQFPAQSSPSTSFRIPLRARRSP